MDSGFMYFTGTVELELSPIKDQWEQSEPKAKINYNRIGLREKHKVESKEEGCLSTSTYTM